MSVGTQIWREAVWQQLGGAIAMLERAIVACPDNLWAANVGTRQFWHTAYHTLFFLDLYLFGTTDGFTPPPPFSLTELDPADVRPERQYTKSELLEYLRYCRQKYRTTIESLTDLEAVRVVEFDWLRMKMGELLLYSLRHVQHHTAQLNLALRQAGIEPPDWYRRATLDEVHSDG
jgi:uncharacterized damage-inducible protein DinB